MLREHVLAVCPFVSRMPENMKEKFIDDLTDEIMTHQIVRPHKKKRQTQEHEDKEITLNRYYVLVSYVKKPRANSVCAKCNTHIE